MPESPEVDALAGFLRTHIVGRQIAGLELVEYGALKTRGRLTSELVGRAVTGIRRFAKHLAIDTEGPSLVVSFGRAGWMRWSGEPATDAATTTASTDAAGGAGSAAGATTTAATTDAAGTTTATTSAPTIAVLSFADGAELLLTDGGTWLSLGLWIVGEPAEVPAIAKLGPDPASADDTADELDRVLAGRRKQLKALLQEQERLAGIGNAYSDEILHAARLFPLTHAADLDEAQRAALFAAVRSVLGDAFARQRGVPIDELKARKVASMVVHGRTGEKCADCGGIVADVSGSRGAAQYCPVCQPER
ncbi:DNA-formamidopyrimidine glycosylase family protein [Microbacterium aurum]